MDRQGRDERGRCWHGGALAPKSAAHPRMLSIDEPYQSPFRSGYARDAARDHGGGPSMGSGRQRH